MLEPSDRTATRPTGSHRPVRSRIISELDDTTDTTRRSAGRRAVRPMTPIPGAGVTRVLPARRKTVWTGRRHPGTAGTPAWRGRSAVEFRVATFADAEQFDAAVAVTVFDSTF